MLRKFPHAVIVCFFLVLGNAAAGEWQTLTRAIAGRAAADPGRFARIDADRPRDEVDMTPRALQLDIVLHAGDATATVYTNDLTHDYVHENSAYSS